MKQKAQRFRLLVVSVVALVLLCGFPSLTCAAASGNRCTIYLDTQGGVGVDAQLSAWKGYWSGYRLYSLPKPTMEGYTFEGWYDDMVGGTKVTTSYSFSDDATIYAHWIPVVSSSSSSSETAMADSGNLLRDHIGTIVVVTGIVIVVVAVVAAQAAQ